MTTSPGPPSAAALEAAALGALRARISAERLSGYDRATDGDLARAVDLYQWNTAVSAAVFEDLGALEVVLRNACHERLRWWNAEQGHRHPWYHHPVLAPRHMQDVGVARNRVAQGKKTETEGRVVAELMFGFWRLLHSKTYEVSLWRPCLRLAYPHRTNLRRAEVYQRLDHLNTLRNRIAHHEPIHGPTIGSVRSDLAALYGELVDLLGWIDPVVQLWVTAHSRVPALLANRP